MMGYCYDQHNRLCCDICGSAARWIDLGLAKTYNPANAYALATEAQRFLMAAEWNG